MSAAAALAHNSFDKLGLNMASKPVKSVTTAQRNIAKHIYDRQFMLSLRGSSGFGSVNTKTLTTLHNLGLLHWSDPAACEAAEFPTSTGRPRERRRRCDRKQKRGCRGGLVAKLKANPFKWPLPSILLANVRSLENKLDYLNLDLSTKPEIRDCCVLIFTETWLNSSVPDVAISLEGLTTLRADRSCALTDKSRAGGVCVYTNNSWCNNATMIVSHCSTDIEFMIIKCRPFYLPWEFSTLIITAVYIPPSANTKEAMCVLYNAISNLQTTLPEGVFMAGDFNQVNMKTVLPNFYQHVDFATRGVNTLDLVYTNIKKAFRAAPRPHLGSSDHLSVMLIPAYKTLLTRGKPTLKHVKVWPEGAMSALQDCFESTD